MGTANLVGAGRYVGILGIVLFSLLAANPARAEYYKCIDEQGLKFWVDSGKDAPPTNPQDPKAMPKCKTGGFDRSLPVLPDKVKYTDRNGIIFWVEGEGKIPPEYRGQSQEETPKEKTAAEPVVPIQKTKTYTKVSIRNNQIIVPVLLVNNGRKTSARMILDTGASSTIIYPALAMKLGMNRNQVAVGVSTIANGSQVQSYQAKIDMIRVDDNALRNPEVVIMQSIGNLGADGLLGNSFLRFFHFTIDYDNQVIVWD